MISRRQFVGAAAAITGAGMAGAADALAVEPGFSLSVKEWTVEHPAWRAAAPPLRIGVLTDLHAVEPWTPARRISGAADQLNARKLDVIALLGDYVTPMAAKYASPLLAGPASLRIARAMRATRTASSRKMAAI